MIKESKEQEQKWILTPIESTYIGLYLSNAATTIDAELTGLVIVLLSIPKYTVADST